ncbi:MAG TPA: hypothetical protein VFV38_05910, partial [Ktedonobacteraceae bacterium]|nr:hypothetical protein [Ktedonobacteraceae bacterium]
MSRKTFPGLLALSLTLSLLLGFMGGTNSIFARSLNKPVSVETLPATAQQTPTHPVSGRQLNLYTLPQENTGAATASSPVAPFLTGRSTGTFTRAKKAAAQNESAPRGQTSTNSAGQAGGEIRGFEGMADSAQICPFFGQAGCSPPDMALAASPDFILQGVNTSFTLYDPSAQKVRGPFNAQTFFGIPNPSPAGCAPNGPFTGDPRAFYDPGDGYFWVAIEEFESSFGLNADCQLLSRYWIANLNARTGAMCVYGFDMALGSENIADYTEFGFNKSTIAFSGDMFVASNAGPEPDTPLPIPGFAYAESQFVNKYAMEQCQTVTPTAFTHYQVGKVLVDTVQPVETETPPVGGPEVEYLVNSFNINGDPFGHDCLVSACQGWAIWAFNPATRSLTGTAVLPPTPNRSYVSAPDADQPGCSQCVETFDTRITGTPVYSGGGRTGVISFAINTAINNGGMDAPHVVPGILWGQIQVEVSRKSVSARLAQSGYLFFPGDQAASFGALMQDQTGRLVMVFDTMSAHLNPSILVVSRRPFDPPGRFGPARFIRKGPAPTSQSRWGDFEAASYDGFGTNQIWVASQYASASSGHWATFIA